MRLDRLSGAAPRGGGASLPVCYGVTESFRHRAADATAAVCVVSTSVLDTQRKRVLRVPATRGLVVQTVAEAPDDECHRPSRNTSSVPFKTR